MPDNLKRDPNREKKVVQFKLSIRMRTKVEEQEAAEMEEDAAEEIESPVKLPEEAKGQGLMSILSKAVEGGIKSPGGETVDKRTH